MSWEKSHVCVVNGVSPEQIWQTWAEINRWHEWDPDIEYARTSMPFEEGSTFELKPRGGPKVQITLHKVEPLKGFTDVTRFPLARMYGVHEMVRVPDGLEIRHTMRVEGLLSFLWRKLVAENVAAGLEDQAQRMIEAAKRKE